ncbi:hypothetical protein Angca_008695, partial [Angiostrongylus cantonensis]
VVRTLIEQKTKLASFLVSEVTSSAAAKLGKIYAHRKAIARILTVINQNYKQKIRKF